MAIHDWRWITAAVLLGCWGSSEVAIAQIIPDTTLGPERSIVNTDKPGNASTYTITGGATLSENLFHSFDQFSLPTNSVVEFNQTSGIVNIITRVTGGTVSNIHGALRTADGTSLFLLNPSGIVFGPNAQLDVGGAFLASTGQGFQFENGFVYDAVTPDVPPLLTISAPIGLSLGAAPGPLQVNGATLAVPEGQTLSLIGGDIGITASQLTAPSGRIEVLGLGSSSQFSLGPGLSSTPNSAATYQNISLSGRSLIDSSGSGGGAISLYGQDITLSQQSAVISDTTGTLNGQGIQITGNQVQLLDSAYIGAATLGSGTGSSIGIVADTLHLIGTGIVNYKQVEFATFLGARQLEQRQIGGITAWTTAAGTAGNITLTTQELVLDEGSLISTESFSTGNGGDVHIVATDLIQVRGSGIATGSRVLGIPVLTLSGTPSNLSTSGIPAGVGGSIDITTAQLTIEDGAGISTTTTSDAASGNVTINATDSVAVSGFWDPFLIPSLISTITMGGQGAAGDILITTGQLTVQDGAAIFADSGSRGTSGNVIFGGPAGDVSIAAAESVDVLGERNLLAGIAASGIRSSTFSDAPAGNLQIATPNLRVLGGGRISTATLNDGDGGAININTQTIVLSGAESNNLTSTIGILANSGIETQINFITGAIESVPASGIGGTITVNTDSLIVQDTAELTVSSFGSGTAGNLNITASTIDLNNNSGLTATTSSNNGGNIALTTNTLALDDSRITASSARKDGGNLLFDIRDTLLLRNGSRISTTAGTAGAGGNGGDITLSLPTGFIVAVPTENSDIRANAFEGSGGNVNVTARSLLGIAFRPNVLDTPLSDITASSQFGSSGTVTITELNPDISQPDTQLPAAPASTTLAQGCRAQGSQQGSFVSTGRGGLPTNPTDPLSEITVWQDIVPIADLAEALPDVIYSSAPSTSESLPPLIEAQRWTRGEDGTVMLIAGQPADLADGDVCAQSTSALSC